MKWKEIERKVNNSFFNNNYRELKVAIFAPHYDDEINLGGGLIPYLIDRGANVYIVYSTNSDYAFPPERRVKENRNASKALGIKEENILILGYADTSFKCEKHLFRSKDKIVKSPSNYMETYGVDGREDYIFSKTGHHHDYTANNYYCDLKSVILDLKADILICVDLDEHPDHRMLSLTFDSVIGELLAETKNTYMPYVLHRFAYALSYYSYADYPSLNIKSTCRPRLGYIEKYNQDWIDTYYYEWETRIRFPLLESCMTNKLSRNIIIRALCCYSSQYGFLQARKIVNGDIVFWERRTNGISYIAHVSVSSGDGKALNDYLINGLDNVMSIVPDRYVPTWCPSLDDKEKTAVFEWDNVQYISEIVIYFDDINEKPAKKIEIKFDTGYSSIYQVPEKLQFLKIMINQRIAANRMTLRLLDCTENRSGIVECEIYGCKSKEAIKPFIKMMIEDDFAYHYYIEKNCERLALKTYRYHNDFQINYSVLQGRGEIKGEYLVIPRTAKRIVVRAECVGNESIFDQIVLQRITLWIYVKHYFQISIHYLCRETIRIANKVLRGRLYVKKAGIRFGIGKLLHGRLKG